MHHHSSLNPEGEISKDHWEPEKSREVDRARKFFEIWNQMLQTKDPKTVAKLYLEMATFFPTLNPELKRGVEGAEKYFEHFLNKNPYGAIIRDTVRTVPEGSLMHSCIYASGQQEKRASIIWLPNGKILHYHSSAKPKE